MKHAYMSACTMALLLGSCSPWFQVETVVDVEGEVNPTIVFDVPVPDVPGVLTVFELRTPEIRPRILAEIGWDRGCSSGQGGSPPPAPSPMPISQPFDPKRQDKYPILAFPPQRCRQDDATGDVEIYPDFSTALESVSSGIALEKVMERARSVLLSEEVLPKDANAETIAQVDRQIIVRHQRATRAPNPDAHPTSTDARADDVLVYTTLVRRVGDYEVDGPGSRIALAVASNQRTEGFVRSWRTATSPREVKARYTRGEVRAEIEKQLLATHPRTALHVQKIELAYYDGNANLLQPVYRIVVEESPSARHLGLPQHFVSYLRYADTSESVPEPSDAATTRKLREELHASRSPTSEQKPVLLGAYVTRNDSADWGNDALGFLTQFTSSHTAGQYSVSQLLPAKPAQFTTESSAYVNSVHLALVEAHGRPWGIATNGRGSEPVFFSPVGRSTRDHVRLGPGVPKGNLRHLVLHSCDVIFSPDETPLWAEPWWTVFQGLTSVVGYRTSMYINDGAGVPFGRSLANGASILAAWFNAVSSLNTYGRDPSLRFSCDGDQTMGRPAAISVCGTENLTLADVSQPLTEGPVACLDAWWIGDSNIPQ